MSKVTKLIKTTIKPIDKQDNEKQIKNNKTRTNDSKVIGKNDRKMNQASTSATNAVSSKKPTATTVAQLTKQTSGINLNKLGQSTIRKSMNLSQAKPNDLLKVKLKATTSRAAVNVPIKATKPINTQLVKRIGDTNKPMSVKNVMNTIHNVTVSSPPAQRKEITGVIPRERTRTRTLEPDEVLVLKNIRDNKDRSLPVQVIPPKSDEITPDSIDESGSYDNNTDAEVSMASIRDPVAFDISFKDEQPIKVVETPAAQEKSNNSSDCDYDDDFESYESDFESGTSSASENSTKSEEQSNAESPIPDNSEIDDTSSLTQEQNSNLKKNDERKLDSGNYELRAQRERLQMNSIEETEQNLSDEQNDSGLGYNNYNTLQHKNPTTALVDNFSQNQNTLKLLEKTKRGNDLMRKLTLDTMTFILFDIKPISYDIYMKLYGKRNTVQSTTQTNNDFVDEEMQTDEKFYNTMWTQYPAVFTKDGFNDMEKLYHEERTGCGCDIIVKPLPPPSTDQSTHNRNNLFNLINNNKKKKTTNNNSDNNKTVIPINYERLNKFLKKTSLTIINLLNKNLNLNKLIYTPLKQSNGYFLLKQNNQNKQIDKLYANVNIKNIFLTIAIRNEMENLIYIWNLMDISKPIHLLHCWNIINCVEVNYYLCDIVLAGLNDGSIAVWDLREPLNYHNKLDEGALEEIYRVPSQIITPDLTPITYGACVSIKTLTITKQTINNNLFNNITKNNECIIEIYVLYETGIIVVWHLIDNQTNHVNITDMNKIKFIKHNTYNTNINLIQNHIIYINNMVEKCLKIRKTIFEKKISYFNGNLFEDNILKELQQQDNDNLYNQNKYNNNNLILNRKFIDFLINNEEIFIATDSNILYYFYKKNLQKIIINDSNYIKITTIMELPQDDSIAIGMSDGCVKILKYKNPDRIVNKIKEINKNKATTSNNHRIINLKSCAIENIIKDERKFVINNFDEHDDVTIPTSQNNNYAVKPIELINKIIIKENKQQLNLINEQIIINKNYFYNNNNNFTTFIKRIDMNKKKQFFYYLINQQLFIYNYKTNYIYNYEKLLNNVKYFHFIYDNNDGEYLVILTTDNDVQIHKMIDEEI